MTADLLLGSFWQSQQKKKEKKKKSKTSRFHTRVWRQFFLPQLQRRGTWLGTKHAAIRHIDNS